MKLDALDCLKISHRLRMGSDSSMLHVHVACSVMTESSSKLLVIRTCVKA